MSWLCLAAMLVSFPTVTSFLKSLLWTGEGCQAWHACSCSVSHRNSHSSDGVPERSQAIVIWLPDRLWCLVAGSSSPLLICLLPEILFLQGKTRGLEWACWDTAVGRKRQWTSPFLFYSNQLQPHELSVSCPPSSRKIWGQLVTCFASFLSSQVELLIAEECIQNKGTVMAGYL